MSTKKISFVISIVILAFFPLLYGASGSSSQDNPVTFSISDGSSGTAAPYLYIKNTSTYTNLALITGTDTDKTYSFEDATDNDFNDLVVRVYIADNNSSSPSIFITELQKDASYDHEIWISIIIPAGHRAYFNGYYFEPGNHDIKVFASSSSALGQTAEIKILPKEDFSLSISPLASIVQQNGTGTYKVSVEFLNGYSGTVNLSASNLPPDTTASFNPSSLSGIAGETKESELKINVGKTAPIGKYMFTVKAESPLKTKELEAEIEIVEVPDFLLKTDSELVRIEPGKTAAFGIFVKPLAGFNDRVMLSTESLPAGFTATIEPNSIVSEGKAVLYLSVPTDILPGTYSFMLKGASGKIIHSLKLSVEVFAYTAELSLTKQVDKNTVTIGEEITFTITSTNKGDIALKDLVIKDTLESAFQFISSMPEAAVEGTQLSINLGDLGIGESKTVIVKARITEAAEQTGNASNFATASSDRILYKRSNTVNINIGIPSLSLTKSVRNANPSFKPGGIVIYEVSLKNNGSAPVYDILVKDQLPSGFYYISGRTIINGTASADPVKIGSELVWKIEKLEPRKELKIIYQVSISADAKTGRHLNTVQVNAVDGSGKTLSAGPAQVLVMVSRGTIILYSIIEGTVFKDLDEDGYFGASDKPLPDVWIMLEQGERTKTDTNGGFIFENVLPGEHFVSLDTRTIPADLEPLKKFYIANPLEGGREYLDIPLAVKNEGSIDGKLKWDTTLSQDITSFSLEGLKVVLDGKFHILSNENGTFLFTGVPIGTHTVSIPSEFLPQGITLTTADSISLEVSKRQSTPVEFVLNGNPYGVLTGRVTAVKSQYNGPQTTTPVEGITLFLNNNTKVISDSNGAFKFDHLIPGKYQLSVDLISLEKMHYRLKSANTIEVEIAAGKIQAVEIQLESMAFLEIKIKR